MSRLKQLINSLVYNTKTPNLTFLLDWVFIIVELEGLEPYSINSSNIIVYHNSYTLVYELGNFEANAILYVVSTLCLHVTQVQI